MAWRVDRLAGGGCLLLTQDTVWPYRAAGPRPVCALCWVDSGMGRDTYPGAIAPLKKRSCS